jgi:hypothetical protein
VAVDPVTPSTIYAVWHGVNKSTDGGATWTPVNTGLTGGVRELVIDPTAPATIYAATDSGIFKSVDGGANWGPMNNGLTETNAYALAMDPTAPATLYAGVQPPYPGGVTVFKTTNGGANWSPSNTGLPTTFGVTSFAIHPVAPATVFATNVGGLYKTTDGGMNWNAVIFGGATYTVAIDPTDPNTVYAGRFNGLTVSYDGGMTWNATGLTGPAVFAVIVDPTYPSSIYVGLGQFAGGWQSNDGGATWFLQPGLDYYVTSLALDPITVPTTIYGSTLGGGLFVLQ